MLRKTVVATLRKNAAREQASILKALGRVRADRARWIVNALSLELTAAEIRTASELCARAYQVRISMAELERPLDPAQFARIHRSTVVTLDRVREISPEFQESMPSASHRPIVPAQQSVSRTNTRDGNRWSHRRECCESHSRPLSQRRQDGWRARFQSALLPTSTIPLPHVVQGSVRAQGHAAAKHHDPLSRCIECHRMQIPGRRLEDRAALHFVSSHVHVSCVDTDVGPVPFCPPYITTTPPRVARTGAPARFGAGIAYDSKRGETILFGGVDSANTKLNDTWRWDGQSWRRAEVTLAPPPRSEGYLAYDEARGVVVMFGGGGVAVVPTLGDTWEWNGTQWTKVRG